MYCLTVLPSASNTEHLGMYVIPYKLAETEEITWNETGEIAQQCNASKKKNMEMMSVSQKKILQACTHPKFDTSWFGRLIVGFKILWIAEMCRGMMMGEENESLHSGKSLCDHKLTSHFFLWSVAMCYRAWRPPACWHMAQFHSKQLAEGLWVRWGQRRSVTVIYFTLHFDFNRTHVNAKLT